MLFFAGCHKEEEIDDLAKEKSRKLQEFAFQLNCYALTGNSNLPDAQKYYYPENLKILTGRYVFDKTKLIVLAEKFFPEGSGIIESSGFYIGTDDDAAWVDELLIRIEEERIAEEINKMEEVLDEAEVSPESFDELNDAANVDNSENADTLAKGNSRAQEIESLLSNEKESVEIRGKSNQLELMNYDKEIFIPQKTPDGWVIIQTALDSIERLFYDDNYRLTTKEIWDIKGMNNSNLLQIETYSYVENSFKPFKKEIETDSKHQIIEFNADGNIINSHTYMIFDENEYLISEVNRTYDELKRVLSTENVDYKYYDETYEKLDYSFSKRYEYKYNEGEDIPPDFEYFENDEIKMKNKYSTEKGSYTSQIFFDKIYSVKTFYESELKIKDVYYKNDEVTRIKEYER